MNKFTLVVNAGRSGSSYIYYILKKNYADSCYVFHESLLTNVTQPKIYNRAYTDDEIQQVLLEPELKKQLEYFSELLKEKPVIECGWTFSHLCPVLQYYFKEQFQVVVMYRNPLHFAASRATMGNYHSDSYYEDHSHEISPFDKKTLLPDYKSKWDKMNPFEKCLFWWHESVSESLEFIKKNSAIPHIVVASEKMFSNISLINELVRFFGLTPKADLDIDQNKNPLHPWTYESFPLKKDWEKWKEHTQLISFAESLGYKFDAAGLDEQMSKYQLPDKWLPKLRYYTHYWKLKGRVKKLIGK